MTISTIKSSGGDYTTLTAWESAQLAVLLAPAEAECYNFDLDDTLSISGITTSASNYVRIYTPSAERHDGRSRTVSGTGFRLKRTAAGGVTLSIAVNHSQIEGIEIEGASSTTAAVTYQFGTFAAGANVHLLDKCIIHDTLTGTGYTLNISMSNLVATIRNTIIYGYQRSWDTRNSATVTSENNTLWRHAAQLGAVSDTELSCKNTYSGHTGAAAEDFYTGAASPTGNNNISSDASQAVDYTAGVSNIAGSAVFTSITPSSEDFRLLTGTNALVEAGATLGSVTTDIIGTARPQGTSYDVGAFERLVSGTSYSYTGSGGILLSGTSSNVKTRIKVSSGGVIFGGAATVTSGTGVQSRTVTPSGGIVFSGTSAQIRSITRAPSGGLIFAGSSTIVLFPDPNPATQLHRKRGRRPRQRIY